MVLQILRTIPGIGKILSFVILYEIQDLHRFPTVQDFTSYARLIRPKKTSAGKCSGSGNGRIGNSSVTWAFSEAVVLFLRETREVQPSIRRMERKYGTEKAKGIVAHRLGRTVYDMLKNTQVFDIKKFVNQEQDSPGQSNRVTLPGLSTSKPSLSVSYSRQRDGRSTRSAHT